MTSSHITTINVA